jgi:MFS family permease
VVLVEQVRIKQARWALNSTFFFIGMTTSATAARFAEIKTNVGATNTAFGLSLMVGNLGSLVGTFIGGRIAHRIGTRRLIRIIMILMALAQTANGFMNALWQVPLVAFIGGFAYAMANVGVNSQGSMIEAKYQRSLMPFFHGSWSVGALFGSLAAGAIAKVLRPDFHLLINSAVALVGLYIVSRGLLPQEFDKQDIEANSEVSQADPVPTEIKRFLYLVSLGSLLALIAEISVGDWSAILLKENLQVPIGANTLGFSAFLFAQITGRLFAGRLIDRFGIPTVIRIGGISGGIGYAVGLLISHAIVVQHQTLAVIIMCTSYFILGLGVAPMPPSYVSVSGQIPGLPTSRALARMGVVSGMGFFLGRGIVSLLAGWIGLQFALLLPAIALIGSGLLASTLRVERITKL